MGCRFSGVCRGVRRARILVGPAGAVCGAAFRARVLQREAPAANLREYGGQRRLGNPRPAGVLAVRRFRGVVRHPRDDERQLVPAGHHHRACGLGDRGVDRAHRLLGDGHSGTGAIRVDRKMGVRSGHVSRVARRPGRHLLRWSPRCPMASRGSASPFSVSLGWVARPCCP